MINQVKQNNEDIKNDQIISNVLSDQWQIELRPLILMISLVAFVSDKSSHQSLKISFLIKGREIFHSPVSLSCPHTYCQTCVFGLKKSTSTNENSVLTSLRPDRETHSTHLHQPNQIFVCAICRQESFGYVRFRALDQQLRQLQSECSNCSQRFTLADLRIHCENCFSTSTTIKTFDTNLSESQSRALQKAQEGENRSTFSCPFCSRTK